MQAAPTESLWSLYYAMYNRVRFASFCDANGRPIPGAAGRRELLDTFVNRVSQAGPAVGDGPVYYVLTFQSRTALPPAAQDVYLGNAEQALLPILAAFDPNSRQMQANSESVYSTAQSLNGNLGYQYFESSPDPVTGYVFPEGFYLCRFLLQ